MNTLTTLADATYTTLSAADASEAVLSNSPCSVPLAESCESVTYASWSAPKEARLQAANESNPLELMASWLEEMVNDEVFCPVQLFPIAPFETSFGRETVRECLLSQMRGHESYSKACRTVRFAISITALDLSL